MSNEDGEALKVQRDKCHKMLADSFKLMRHVQTVHKESKQFQCEYCEHRDKRSDNMKTHIRKNHENFTLPL